MKGLFFPEKISNYGSPYVISKGYMWRIDTDDQIMIWGKVNADLLKGRIDTEQESCPCVYITVYELNEEGNIVRMYEEVSRRGCSTTLTLLDQKSGKWWAAEYCQGKLCEIKETTAPKLPENENQTELVIDDTCGLLKSLKMEKMLAENFP